MNYDVEMKKDFDQKVSTNRLCNENQLHPSPKGRLIFNNFPLGIQG